MDKISLKVNGQEVEASPGQTILEVVEEQGLDEIPTLCHSSELQPYGSCFICVVEVNGRWNLLPACATRVSEGMEVETRNERIIRSRKTALELLCSNHYADCVSPCQEGCPANVDAQGYIALAAMGEYRRAVDLIRETNPFPAVCGRVCVRKCEDVCRRMDIDASVAINNVKRFISDSPDAYATRPVCDEPTGRTAGIVGAGPSGLTAAWFLARRGIAPVVYEAMEETGGMLRYGIPEYRLPDEVLDREVDYIRRTGVDIRCGVRVGEDVTLAELRERHDALYLAVGAWTGKSMRVEGEHDTEGVVTGADWLPEMHDRPEKLSGTVVVVGGGNTAMDAARTAWRLEADKVIVLYRRTRAEMPADEMEIEDCLEEGVELMELAAPTGIVSEDGKLQALTCIRMKLGEPDASGRRRPVPLEGSEFDLPCDLVISAIGQNVVLDGVREVDGSEIEATRWDTYVTDQDTMATNLEGVFAGGDAADDGPTVVIDAIRDGQRAAKSMIAYLLEEEAPERAFRIAKEHWSKPGKAELGDIPESPRHGLQMLDVDERRGSFREVATGFPPEDVDHEADRCLSCGCVRFDDCRLRIYAEEYGVDMERWKGYVRKHKVDDRHPYIVYDPNKCVLCSRCIRTCARVLPVSALGLVNRGFQTEMRPAMNDPLVETSCVSCGNCVDACPTAALTVKYPFEGRACLETEDVPTHCGFCSLTCGVTVRRFADDRYFIASTGEPGDYLCRYGRFGHELFIGRERLGSPLLRSGGSDCSATVRDAARSAVDGLRRLAEEHGPESVAVFVSPELTNEEMYLASRIAREGLGTANVGSLAMLAGGGRSGALDGILGFTASTADRSCLRDADLVICNNTALESDHLILAVDVIAAVREREAGLIVANSTLESTDLHLADLAVDPMRGRASIFWNAVVEKLMDSGAVSREDVRRMEGGSAFLERRNVDLEDAARRSGVDVGDIERAAELIAGASKVVVIHSPDRPQDASPGDMELFADLVLMLRGAGTGAELLLPRLISNSAGLEVTGADPAFLPGRTGAGGDLPGATSRSELRRMLEEGELRGALVLGENPMESDRTATWLRNLEFLVAMDWTETETTSYADVVLPGSTYLETPGTRCNFEGELVTYARAVDPPAGMSGTMVLARVAEAAGLDPEAGSEEELAAELDRLVRESLGELVRFLWNTGEKRSWSGTGRMRPAAVDAKASSISPPLTHGQRYRSEIREVGTERYRVR